MAVIIQTEVLTRRYGRQTAVDGLSLKSTRGNVRLPRPNGAGKTTTILMLLGLTGADRWARPRASASTRRMTPLEINARSLPAGERRLLRRFLTGRENLRYMRG